MPWQKRHTRQRAGSGWAWQQLKARILDRDGYACHWCGRMAETADHVVPVAEGGSDDPGNLVAACRACNERRGREAAARGRGRSNL